MADPTPNTILGGFDVWGVNRTILGGFDVWGVNRPDDPSIVDKLAAKIDPEIAEQVREREAHIVHWERIGHVAKKMADEMVAEIDADILRAI